jgi:hypothetical protein
MLSLDVRPLAHNHNGRNESMDETLDRCSHELQLLANFYHQNAYRDRAQELYRVVIKIRNDRDKQRKKFRPIRLVI